MSDKEARPSPIEARLAAPPSGPPEGGDESVTRKAESSGELIQSRWAVLAILFGVTGVLGLPLLWMNRSFSNPERIFWSVVVTIYTGLLVWLAVAIVLWSYRQVVGL